MNIPQYYYLLVTEEVMRAGGGGGGAVGRMVSSKMVNVYISCFTMDRNSPSNYFNPMSDSVLFYEFLINRLKKLNFIILYIIHESFISVTCPEVDIVSTRFVICRCINPRASHV